MVSALGIGIDWGSSNIRAWLLQPDGTATAQGRLAIGLGEARARGFDLVLQQLLAALPPAGNLPMIACGMVGARDGWHEAPYLPCPVEPVEIAQAARPAPGSTLKILPGIISRGPLPDVMRGEETQLISMIAQMRDATFCIPGTHSKWAQVEKGRLTAFRTYATGDLFAAARKSAVFAALTEEAPFDASAFREGVKLSATVPLARALFQTRSRVVTGNMRPEQAYWFLSGLTIGAELQYELEDAVAPLMLLAEGTLRELYEFAFGTLGRPVTCVSSADATRAGLTLALQHQAGA
ncbi:MAG: 2-dehydro-3-deoxygalactonokinase [Rhizobiaceae bacterium]|nr:2-dehydro-3-deoxygalactonokinase [Rhizobiaceae bacterium]